MIDLEKCPFCGGEADYVSFFVSRGRDLAVHVECSVCGARNKDQYVRRIDYIDDSVLEKETANRYERVANHWNRRVGA